MLIIINANNDNNNNIIKCSTPLVQILIKKKTCGGMAHTSCQCFLND